MTDTSAIVAVCLADPIARDLAIRTIAREGATGRSVSIAEIQDACRIRGGDKIALPWDILIYDLAPRDGSLLDLLESLHQNPQPLQILIYTQPQPGDGKLLSAALKLDGTVVKYRFENGMERLRLGDVLRQLIGKIPTRRLHGLIRLLVPDVPHRANQFIARALDRIILFHVLWPQYCANFIAAILPDTEPRMEHPDHRVPQPTRTHGLP